MRACTRFAALSLCCALLGAHCATISAAAPAAGKFVSFPYNATDGAGNAWNVFQNGMLQQRSNQPIFGQAAVLSLNGEALQGGTNRARQDDQTGEIVLDNLSAAGMTVTRRVLLSSDNPYVRYIDVIRNPTAQDQSLDVQLQSRVNFGLVSSQTVPDPRMKDRVLAWVGQTQINRTGIELLAGPSAKDAFTFAWQQENNLLQADMTVKVPAGKELALMHVYSTASSVDAGVQWVTAMKQANLLKKITPDIRKTLINFNSGSWYVGGAELLRGDLLDIVELRDGDRLKGTLKEPVYALHTFYGDINLPAEQVNGLINVGEYRPRQLVATADGQAFGGQLASQTIPMELSSGQLTQIPLSEISRLGYRKRPGELDDGAGDQSGNQIGNRPILFLRTGDRIAVLPPAQPIDFMTRYGLLKFDRTMIQSLVFQSDDNAVHTAVLTDGSHISGLVEGEEFKMVLAGAGDGVATATQPAGPSAGAERGVIIPAAQLLQWQMTDKIAEPDADAPSLRLSNGDLFVGALSGQLKLDTLFDAVSINANEIHTLTHAADAGGDVQIELWDQTRLSGRLEEPELACALNSGDTLSVPAALIDLYTQPEPRPPEMMVRQIKQVVANLAADDWKQRDQAQSQLAAMGPMISGVLKQLLPTAPPEAQQRLEAVLKQFAAKK
jgi:hypothetical protein